MKPKRIDRGLEICSRFFDITELIFGLFGMIIGFPFALLGWMFPEKPRECTQLEEK